jgi:octopine/nopaline transport system permease protein
MIDPGFLAETLLALLGGVPLTVELAVLAVALGAILAFGLAAMRLSGNPLLDLPARAYVFAFRGTPLLVQIYLVYYGFGQFAGVRASLLWPYLREAWWCALLALTLNTAAYAAEIVRGGLLGVGRGQIEAARACGMSRRLVFTRVVLPQALRLMLPAYGNEIVLMVKSTALASTITLMEVTGIGAKIASATYRPVEVFAAAGLVYFVLNLVVARAVAAFERRLTPERRPPRVARPARGPAA